jgi:hypothetical protein
MAKEPTDATLFADLPLQSDGKRHGLMLRYHRYHEYQWNTVLTGAESQVWGTLEHFAHDREGGVVRAPDDDLTLTVAKAVGHSTTANVRTAIRTLVRARLVEVLEPGGGGKGLVIRMLVAVRPEQTDLGKERLGRVKRRGQPHHPVEIKPGIGSSRGRRPGSTSAGSRLKLNREPVEVQPIPGLTSTAHHIRRINDEDDGNDVHARAPGTEQRPDGNPEQASRPPTPDPTPEPPEPERPSSVAASSASGRRKQPTPEDIYAAYPRKVGKQDALKKIRAALAGLAKRGAPPEGSPSWPTWLLAQTAAYAEARNAEVAADPEESQYTPHPATWFNKGRYEDDQAEWKRKRLTREQRRGEFPEPNLKLLPYKRKRTAAEKGEYVTDLPTGVMRFGDDGKAYTIPSNRSFIGTSSRRLPDASLPDRACGTDELRTASSDPPATATPPPRVVPAADAEIIRAAAVDAMTRWGDGCRVRPEVRAGWDIGSNVQPLLEWAAHQAPVLCRGMLTPVTNLLPRAIDACRERGVDFRTPTVAAGEVRRQVESWRKRGSVPEEPASTADRVALLA